MEQGLSRVKEEHKRCSERGQKLMKSWKRIERKPKADPDYLQNAQIFQSGMTGAEIGPSQGLEPSLVLIYFSRKGERRKAENLSKNRTAIIKIYTFLFFLLHYHTQTNYWGAGNLIFRQKISLFFFRNICQ